MGTVLLLASGAGFARDKEDSKGGVGEVDAAWIKAVKSGDVEAAVKCYGKNAVLWIGGMPQATGEAEIRAAYQNWFNTTTITAVSLRQLGQHTHGDDSVGWGTYSMTTQAKSGGKPVTVTGRYSEAARGDHGHWVYVMDHADDDPAPKK